MAITLLSTLFMAGLFITFFLVLAAAVLMLILGY